MQITEKAYSKEEFKNYLIDHSDEIFEEDKRRRWLKIYCILVSDESWQRTLFSDNELIKMGEIFKAIGKKNEDNDDEEQYYIMEYCSGLLLMYTTATKQEYRETLGKRIEQSLGATRMWMRPKLFETFWKGILDETGGFVYRFTSRRGPLDTNPCKIRPEYKRRFNYTGDDGTQTLAELEELYGATPESIYMEIDENLKIHITNDGLYSAQEISADAMNLFFKYLDEIKDSILEMRKVSKSMKFEVVSEFDLKTVSIESGIIKLRDCIVDPVMAEKMMKALEKFSFIDLHLEAGSVSLTATVVDEIKGSIFNINASESQILIVPKIRTTFESFIGFYRGIVESVDEYAEFSLLSYAQ
jgi:hypothetical protein